MKQKTILVDAINAFVDKSGTIDADLHALLEKYPNRKILVTGADEEEMKMYGLTNMPYEIFTLKHEPNKADPLYFNTLLMYFHFDSDEVVYFEHDAEAVKSARSVGIVTHHYVSEQKDYVALKEFLNVNV